MIESFVSSVTVWIVDKKTFLSANEAEAFAQTMADLGGESVAVTECLATLKPRRTEKRAPSRSLKASQPKLLRK